MSSAAVVQRRWTYRDLVALPEDNLRHELLDGEHVVSPSPALAHQQVSMNLIAAIVPYLEEHPAGRLLHAPFDVKLSLFTVLVPDLVHFTAERFARVVNEKHAIAAPDLVVEISRRAPAGATRAASAPSTSAKAPANTGSWIPRRCRSPCCGERAPRRDSRPPSHFRRRAGASSRLRSFQVCGSPCRAFFADGRLARVHGFAPRRHSPNGPGSRHS